MEKICKTLKNRTKFVIEYQDYKYTKVTVVYIKAYKQERNLNGRFDKYRYWDTLRKDIKAANPETRERNLKKYLLKFDVTL